MNTLKAVNKIHTTPKDFDWVRNHKDTYSFVKPPRIEVDETFKEDIPEIVDRKIKEALQRQTILKKEQKQRQQIILKNTELRDSYFWQQLDSSFFSEYFLIEEWIRYWVRLSDRVNNKVSDKETITDIDILKAKDYPIQDLYEGDLKKSGSRLKGKCPFHEEKTPSFFIYSDNGYKCYGCGEAGDSISFAMKTRKISFKEAIKQLT